MKISLLTRSRLLLASTFLVAMIVSLVRWPDWAQSFRPDWVGLVLIYWCLAIPHRVGVGTGFVVGLMEDILYGSLLGQYALAKTVIAFIAVRMHLKIRMFPRWQQAVVVFLLLLMGQLIVAWAKALTGQSSVTIPYFTPSIVSMVLWPWLFVILRDIRRRGHIE
jgi:rod shape-determining protein MreD